MILPLSRNLNRRSLRGILFRVIDQVLERPHDKRPVDPDLREIRGHIRLNRLPGINAPELSRGFRDELRDIGLREIEFRVPGLQPRHLLQVPGETAKQRGLPLNRRDRGGVRAPEQLREEFLRGLQNRVHRKADIAGHGAKQRRAHPLGFSADHRVFRDI